MNRRIDDMSIREKNLWIELLTDVVVALYYWPKAFGLMQMGDAALRGGAMAGLITNTVMFAIVVNVVVSVFVQKQEKPEPMDERDYMIAARSSMFAGRVLVACLVGVMGLVVLQEFSLLGGANGLLPALGPLALAHLLLILVMLWSVTGSVARIFCYRRGY